MKKDRLTQLTNEGFKLRVYLQGGQLKSYLHNEEKTNVIHPVYYNHAKSVINEDQKVFIKTFNEVKSYTFREDVEINIKHKGLKETKEDVRRRVMRKAIKKKEYICQD